MGVILRDLHKSGRHPIWVLMVPTIGAQQAGQGLE